MNLRGDVRENQTVTVDVTNPVMKCTGSQNVTATVDTSPKTVWNRTEIAVGDTIGATGTTVIYPVSARKAGDPARICRAGCMLRPV